MNEIPNNAKLPRNQMKRRIAPGIWEDKEDNVHWSIPELLALFKIPDTPENQAMVRHTVAQFMQENGVEIIIHRDKPD